MNQSTEAIARRAGFSSPSTPSSTSSTSSTSSDSSAITIAETVLFQERYAVVNNKELPLSKLVSDACRLIDELSFGPEQNIINHRNRTLHAHDVLFAMLRHADQCGGRDGTRYAATAICGCIHNKEWDAQETLGMLRGLAETWISHLLFIFKRGSHSQQWNGSPSRIATPTLRVTRSLLQSPATRSRSTNLRDAVLKRDGYRCVVTGLIELSHPEHIHSKQLDVPRHRLLVCHILRRAAAVCNRNRRDPSYLSAISTFDILRHYANLPNAFVSDLNNAIDKPSNAFVLDPRLHYGFDDFEWCLIATENPNVYTVKKFSDFSALEPGHVNKTIEFINHSAEDIALPNPRFIAIHAAIAGILHMSGAGRFLDELLGKFNDGEDSYPITHSFSELPGPGVQHAEVEQPNQPVPVEVIA